MASKERDTQQHDHQGQSSSTHVRREKEVERLGKVKHSLNVSIRYHAKRCRFFEAWHNFSTAVAAIFGASSFCLLLSDSKEVAKWTTAIIGVITTLDLIIGFNKRADRHNILKQRFADLLIRANIVNDDDVTYELVQTIQNERLLIEKDEPTELVGLSVICHNEECQSTACNDDIYAIPQHIMLLRHFWSFDGWTPTKIAKPHWIVRVVRLLNRPRKSRHLATSIAAAFRN